MIQSSHWFGLAASSPNLSESSLAGWAPVLRLHCGESVRGPLYIFFDFSGFMLERAQGVQYFSPPGGDRFRIRSEMSSPQYCGSNNISYMLVAFQDVEL